MLTSLIVLDASVAIKWFHNEDDTEKAEKLQKLIVQGEVRAIVPPLFFYEVANVLTMKPNADVEEIIEAHKMLESLPFQVTDVIHTVLEEAIRIAHDRKVSVYDAIYVALAVLSDAMLITADKRLAENINSPIVQLLSNYER